MAKILLVDDDEDLASTVVLSLNAEMHTVDSVNCGEDGLSLLAVYDYDAIVLDLQMPGIGGLEVLRQYRSKGGSAPVLILTGKTHVNDKEIGLDTGADDYLTKPFSLRELAARLRALLRRPKHVKSNNLVHGDIALDTQTCQLTKNGVIQKMQPRDLALLEFFLRNPNQVFSIDTLLARVWNFEAQATADGLRTAVSRIRKVVDHENASDSIIENVPKLGYRLRS
jgi:DNA-binding response OmpR family regulator